MSDALAGFRERPMFTAFCVYFIALALVVLVLNLRHDRKRRITQEKERGE